LFSRTLEYALRAVAHLALQAPSSVTAKDLAIATRVPEPYLHKVLQQLRNHKIVVSQRGVGGGIRLARQADQLTILDVANAVEPVPRIRSCPLELAGHGINLCPLHRRLDNALSQIEQTFAASTLADLLHDQDGVAPLCPFPKVKQVKCHP